MVKNAWSLVSTPGRVFYEIMHTEAKKPSFLVARVMKLYQLFVLVRRNFLLAKEIHSMFCADLS